MNKLLISFFLFCTPCICPKRFFEIGDRYADDQIYLQSPTIKCINNPVQFYEVVFLMDCPAGFIKDIILNKKGTISFALGAWLWFRFL